MNSAENPGPGPLLIRGYDELSEFEAPPWCLDPVATGIYLLFGENTFVTAAADYYNDEKTLESTRAQEEQNVLERSNIVVKCGSVSENLCALRVDKANTIEAVLELNPTLATTLITSERGVLTLWLRVTGPCPGNADLAGVHWTSSGPVLLVNRQALTHTGYVTSGAPIQIDFEQIVWPAEQASALDDFRLVEAFGQPLIKNEANPQYWAVVFVRCSHYHWDPGTEEFWDGLTGQPVPTAMTIKNAFSRMVMEFTRGDRRLQHALSKLCHGKQWRVTLGFLKADSIKSQEGSLETDFADFLKANIEIGCTGDVTISEIVAAYLKHCVARSKPASPKGASSLIRPLMRATFGACPSKSILRDRKEQNGFRRTRLRQTRPLNQTNGVAGAGGVPG